MPAKKTKLTEQQKSAVFKQRCSHNYRASLELEGFNVEKTKIIELDTKSKTESELINELMKMYVR